MFVNRCLAFFQITLLWWFDWFSLRFEPLLYEVPGKSAGSMRSVPVPPPPKPNLNASPKSSWERGILTLYT